MPLLTCIVNLWYTEHDTLPNLIPEECRLHCYCIHLLRALKMAGFTEQSLGNAALGRTGRNSLTGTMWCLTKSHPAPLLGGTIWLHLWWSSPPSSSSQFWLLNTVLGSSLALGNGYCRQSPLTHIWPMKGKGKCTGGIWERLYKESQAETVSVHGQVCR